jgi:5-methyltetrahydropteroyltriglutamate--homocysteine methyltransferase
MIRSTDRILVTHAGTLPRPADVTKALYAKAAGAKIDQDALTRNVRQTVADVVRKQAEVGIDSVNDGEISKANFTFYIRERLGGIALREVDPAKAPPRLDISGRDAIELPDYFAAGLGTFADSKPNQRIFCTGPLEYVGQAALKADLENFRAAVDKVNVPEAFLPAITPGTIEHWLNNEHYKDQESFLFAIAEALRPEYKAIVDTGFLLQIDDPDLPDGWQMYPEMTVKQYQDYAALRVAALNHALRDIPREKIRLHVCWGSAHGPHVQDIALQHIIDTILSVKASSYSIEASNPRHEHEWRVFENVKWSKDAVLIPGVIGHCTDVIEHPELVAQRLVRYAKLVGRENVMAGTDCGVGSRVGHSAICWAKLKAMAEGARLATKELWGRN